MVLKNYLFVIRDFKAAMDLGWKAGPTGIRKMKPDVLLLLGADGRKVSRADLCNEYQIEGEYIEENLNKTVNA